MCSSDLKVHYFVTASSCVGNLVYKMLFTDGDEREVPLPQPALFSVHMGLWSRSKEELDEQLCLLGFHVQHDSEDQEDYEAPSDDYTVYYPGASSSSGATLWPRWD